MARCAIPFVLQSPVTGSALVGDQFTFTRHVPGKSLGSGEAATIYTTETEATTTGSNVLTTDVRGSLTQGESSSPIWAQYWIAPGTYDILISGAGLKSVYVVRDLVSGQNGEWEPGDLKLSAATNLPSGWLKCEGQEVLRSTYTALFTAIGITFGEGNKSTTFNVPNYIERVPMGPGGTNARGAKLGAATVALTTAQLAKHGHALTDPKHSHTIPSNTVQAEAGGWYAKTEGGAFTQPLNDFSGTGSALGSSATGITLAESGSGEAHNNIQPSTVCNVWIKT
jgi:microcystin-dependent protein